MRVDFHLAILVASVARMHGRPGHQRAPWRRTVREGRIDVDLVELAHQAGDRCLRIGRVAPRFETAARVHPRRGSIGP